MKKTKLAKRKAPQHNTSPAEETPVLWIKHLCKSFLITIASGFGLLLALSLAAYFYSDPNLLIHPMALIVAGLTALIGGIAAVRIHGHSALICGLLNGCILLGVMLLLSLFFKGQGIGYSAGVSCLLHAGIPVLSVAGAYLGLRRSPKKRSRR